MLPVCMSLPVALHCLHTQGQAWLVLLPALPHPFHMSACLHMMFTLASCLCQCRYAGSYEHVFETTTAGVTIQAPQLDVNTVAAGGPMGGRVGETSVMTHAYMNPNTSHTETDLGSHIRRHAVVSLS
jgi:hypothetical protein